MSSAFRWALGLVCVAIFFPGDLSAKDDKDSNDALLDFVVGTYAVIGQEPDGGATYDAFASIGRDGADLVLRRRRGEHEVTATGNLDVPSPPGHGKVLRFRWRAPEPTLMTCLIGTDLDNYPRLTCYWLREGSQPKQPGLEAMFPTAAWSPGDQRD